MVREIIFVDLGTLLCLARYHQLIVLEMEFRSDIDAYDAYPNENSTAECLLKGVVGKKPKKERRVGSNLVQNE